MITLAILRLTAIEPFAITAPEVAEASDLPVVKDPRTGYLVIPGTTVAGSIRAHCLRSFGAAYASEWFGPEIDPNKTIDASSRVRIVGALIHQTNGAPVLATIANPHIQTSIDLRRRAAQVHTRRDSDVVPKGLQVGVYVRIDDLDPVSPEALQLLGEFATWNPTLGRAKTTGHGKMRQDSCHTGSIDLADPNQRWQWITLHGQDLFDQVCTVPLTPTGAAANSTVISERFRIVDPLRIGGGMRGAGQHNNRRMLPVRRTITGNENAPYDGSSLKGVLRGRCECIVNSIRDARNLSRDSSIVDEVFGSVSSRGLIRFLDAPVINPLTGFRSHVAIDRVSGGARDSALFVDEVYDDGELSFTLETIDGSVAPQYAVELLGMAFNDLSDGFVGVGSSTGRGYGTLGPVGKRNPIKLSVDTITRICRTSAEEALGRAEVGAPASDGVGAAVTTTEEVAV